MNRFSMGMQFLVLLFWSKNVSFATCLCLVVYCLFDCIYILLVLHFFQKKLMHGFDWKKSSYFSNISIIYHFIVYWIFCNYEFSWNKGFNCTWYMKGHISSVSEELYRESLSHWDCKEKVGNQADFGKNNFRINPHRTCQCLLFNFPNILKSSSATLLPVVVLCHLKQIQFSKFFLLCFVLFFCFCLVHWEDVVNILKDKHGKTRCDIILVLSYIFRINLEETKEHAYVNSQVTMMRRHTSR